MDRSDKRSLGEPSQERPPEPGWETRGELQRHASRRGRNRNLPPDGGELAQGGLRGADRVVEEARAGEQRLGGGVRQDEFRGGLARAEAGGKRRGGQRGEFVRL